MSPGVNESRLFNGWCWQSWWTGAGDGVVERGYMRRRDVIRAYDTSYSTKRREASERLVACKGASAAFAGAGEAKSSVALSPLPYIDRDT